jgi:hypothetical protein
MRRPPLRPSQHLLSQRRHRPNQLRHQRPNRGVDGKGYDVTQSSMLAGSERVGLRALGASYPTTGLVEGDLSNYLRVRPIFADYAVKVRVKLDAVAQRSLGGIEPFFPTRPLIYLLRELMDQGKSPRPNLTAQAHSSAAGLSRRSPCFAAQRLFFVPA